MTLKRSSQRLCEVGRVDGSAPPRFIERLNQRFPCIQAFREYDKDLLRFRIIPAVNGLTHVARGIILSTEWRPTATGGIHDRFENHARDSAS